jgi:hypothetical protein
MECVRKTTEPAGMLEIKQYGLHRSGTNFLRVILQENYRIKVLMNEGGWKHGFFDLHRRLGREVHCMLCVKDPYAWLVSFYNYRHPDRDLLFSDFVRNPLTVLGPRGQDDSIQAGNPVQLWVRMYEHWLSINLEAHRVFLFRYEDVLSEPTESIQGLVGSLGLRRKESWCYRLRRLAGLKPANPEFYLPEIRLGALQDHYKGKHLRKGVAFDPSRYTQRKYLQSFTPDLFEFVNEHLDPRLLARLGYGFISPRALALA